MKIVVITFKTMLYQLGVILHYECWHIEHVLFHKKRNKSYCSCCNLVPQGVECLKTNIGSFKFALHNQQERYWLKLKYYIKCEVKPFIINIFSWIENIRVIQYIYWKVRIKAIKLRLINGKSGHTTMKL